MKNTQQMQLKKKKKSRSGTRPSNHSFIRVCVVETEAQRFRPGNPIKGTNAQLEHPEGATRWSVSFSCDQPPPSSHSIPIRVPPQYTLHRLRLAHASVCCTTITTYMTNERPRPYNLLNFLTNQPARVVAAPPYS